ncbi:1-phosphofructokinase [Pleomorphomonas sp. PLEO]|uniref:1-phosphofructokinase n=1 Tax=Pleomorphomonas sp. PLEO TaxID=3239306 RepID=UPI00351E4026
MTSPIITVTLNPAIDLTVTLDDLTPGKVHRARAAQSNVGGKGINVAGCIADWGIPVVATGVLGRGNDATFTDFFKDKGIQDRFVRTAGDTRTNIKIADIVTGTTTDINLPGLTFDDETYDMVLDVLRSEVVDGALVVLAGSLPLGQPASVWARLTADLSLLRCRVVLDTSGAPLAASLAAPSGNLPFAVKPNRLELESWVGRPLKEVADIVTAARDIQALGIELVAVSRGEQGAIFLRGTTALSARLPVVNALSTVGAGDAMVAGIASSVADNLGLEALARRAVAFATAKLGRIGPNLPSPDDVRQLARRVDVAVLAS